MRKELKWKRMKTETRRERKRERGEEIYKAERFGTA